MTTWIETPEGGRDRGGRALARAWVEVLVRPRRFFRAAVSPADQAPGLTFAMAVTAASIGGMFLVSPDLPPAVAGSRLAGGLVVLGFLVLFVAPVSLHLAAAVGTVGLVAVAPDRAGVSETVQLVGYSTAPLALAWIPVAVADLPVAWAVTGALGYAAGLLVVGIATRHRTGPVRAVVAAVPAVGVAATVVTAIRVGNAVVFGS